MKKELINNLTKVNQLLYFIEDKISQADFKQLDETLSEEFVNVLKFNHLLNYSSLHIITTNNQAKELIRILEIIKEEVE